MSYYQFHGQEPRLDDAPPAPSGDRELTVHDALDELDQTSIRLGQDGAHHLIRAYAHNLGLHLTSCAGGKRVAPEGPNRTDRTVTS